MSPRIMQIPLSGGDRKAQAKRVRNDHGLHDSYLSRSQAIRSAADEKLRQADRPECEAWNAIMWAGGPAMPAPGEPQANPTIDLRSITPGDDPQGLADKNDRLVLHRPLFRRRHRGGHQGHGTEPAATTRIPMRFCLRCDDTGFVCEAHPALPWMDSARGCRCGAPGDPCPVCAGDLLESEPPAIDPHERDDLADALTELALRRRRRH
ncbi:hypothetical protein ACQR13_21115 [Bradyrhizobium sp. HKCCYLRH3059]|uniref:hypothetical protein n=1 Tax=Bradyrhizobium sp. HKCCYLRH3059 TaxID=3420745 RepID=UPI003EBB7A64